MKLLAFALLFALAAAAPARAADAPQTADVLGKLHRSNLKEIAMGKLARARGASKETKAYGKTLVDDHAAADKKVGKLAKDEGIDLATTTPAAEHEMDLGKGAAFDAAFAREMLDDHERDLADAKAARDGTSDPKLKALLDDMIPVLEKHRDTAKRLTEQVKS
jgi:putative membrane protein